MERSLVRLECLKLVKTHLGPDEMIAQAKQLEAFVLEQAEIPSIPTADNSIPLPRVLEPDDSAKAHKNNSKK